MTGYRSTDRKGVVGTSIQLTANRTSVRGNKMEEMFLGTRDRNDPGNVKGTDGRSNCFR
jgi:hypothetical protein